MNAVRTLIVGSALLGGLSWVAVSEGQQPLSPPAVATPAPKTQSGVQDFRTWPMAPGARQDSSHQAVQLAQQYAKAAKEDEKKEIRKKLTEVLSQQFDQRLQQQQKEVDDLEKQIASLKDVLKKRTAAKATIVDRRIENLVQEAEGLGWNNPSSPHSMNPYGGGFGGYSGGSFGRSGQLSPTPPSPRAP